MDRISDFFKEIKDRISNPLIASFILAWLVCNWKIVIGLLFYDLPQLQRDGYVSYIDLIEQENNTWRSVILPLILAFVYTYFFPFIRNWTVIYLSWMNSWREKKSLNVARSSSIPITKYLSLRSAALTQSALLEKTIKEESDYISRNSELQQQLQSQIEKNEQLVQLEKLNESVNDVKILNGDWELHDQDSNTTMRLSIHDGAVSSLSNSVRRTWKILNFHASLKLHKVEFVLCSMLTNSDPEIIAFRLEFPALENRRILEMNGFKNGIPSKVIKLQRVPS